MYWYQLFCQLLLLTAAPLPKVLSTVRAMYLLVASAALTVKATCLPAARSAVAACPDASSLSLKEARGDLFVMTGEEEYIQVLKFVKSLLADLPNSEKEKN